MTVTKPASFIRGGLCYDLQTGPERHYLITCAAPFTVDEIRYDPLDEFDDDRVYHRPMIELIDDEAEIEAARMYHATPPTDTELDLYVRDNHLPPIPKGTPHGNPTVR